MSYIYTKAVRVLVWLQHEDDQVVQDSLNAICRLVCEEDAFSRFESVKGTAPNILYRWLDVDVTTVSQMEPSELTNVAIDALELVCHSPWFGRGWVVQEVALSTSTSVFWGHSEIDVEWLAMAAYYVSSKHSFRVSQGIVNCQFLHLVWRKSRRSWGPRQSLINLIYSTTDMAFNEPKDRIYGLLGLETLECDLANGQSFIDPDYNITTMECYRRVAAKLLSEWHDLRVLSWTRPVPESAKDWPSWVPDWSGDPDPALADLIDEERQEKNTSGLVQISETAFGKTQCIEITGFRVGTINREIKEYANLADYQDDPCLFEGLQALLRHLEHMYSQQCLAFTFGNALRGRPLNSTRIANRLSEYSAFMERDCVLDIYSPPAGAWSDDRSDRFVPSADMFAFDCDLVIKDHRLFVTSTEMLGIGPRAMIPGDVVVVLHGGQVPFVLRPADNGLWRLVGECYLYDVNEGRVHREWEEKGSVSEKFTIC
jgi:hypothetical protein